MKKIPKDGTATYARIAVDYLPQKADPNQVWITAGGNLINYPGKLTTCIANIATAKTTKVNNEFIYMEIRRGIYGLSQAGMLANKLLKERLAPYSYHKVQDAPGLFKHETWPIQFTLVVHNFGFKNVGKQHANHLVAILKK